jgi:hypothetical protein
MGTNISLLIALLAPTLIFGSILYLTLKGNQRIAHQLILRILYESKRRMTGLEIITASNDSLKRGAVYVYLSQLQNDGKICSDLSGEGPSTQHGLKPRRVYWIADA